ncbi:AIPR family protein [Hyphomonas sp.]|uniref:AIPR family protein n=1 Tax=Hyphomonas sp. TaxID=87 RepID=UPI000E08117A|nr:AIPR family protein [Hyphomonas sp.]RCL90140.1 MAG: AIPR family protein [Hyphomonas sp.]
MIKAVHLQDAFDEFLEDVNRTAQANGLLQSEAFFQLYTEAATESGDIEDSQYCPVLRDARPPYRIDGYYLNAEQGELGLLICDFRSDSEVQAVNAADCDALFTRVLRFFENSLSSEFINNLEDQSPAFEAAYLIHSSMSLIRRVRVIILTSGRLSVRKASLSTRTVAGVRFTTSVLDFQRYVGILTSKRGVDPIEIDLRENGLAPLQCLQASSGASSYSAYLVVVPATILAEIYGLFGARLLEANVRTYLQARTKVNKGMQVTLKTEPRNFFAYNNGLTATASSVTVENVDGVSHLTEIHDLQIVNGGQTTASILYARDKEKACLDDVYVQMKLSVVSEDAGAEIVPNISRFANSQNKISDADFFSSHPFHQHVEKMSRRISAPVREGELIATKWFYERARGQYRDQQAYLTPAQKRKFQAEFPKDQLVLKTDLAKYELAFGREPHTVSLGAQKCFMAFAKHIDGKWTSDAVNFGDGYFRDAMARALIFRWTDRMIGTSDWYLSNRAYKSQTVAYTIAVLSHMMAKRGVDLDYRRIWNRQDVPPSLARILEELAPYVANFIRQTPDTVRNVGEYCKKQFCWTRLCEAFDQEGKFNLPDDFVLEIPEKKERARQDKAVRKIDSSIDAQTLVFKLGGDHWSSALGFAQKCKIGTPNERGVLEVCAQIPNRLPSEKQCLVAIKVLSVLEERGFKF